jgi:uncharacterized membrane protein
VFSANHIDDLKKFIDIDNIPGYLGGTLTDPDGDPMCRTMVIMKLHYTILKFPVQCYQVMINVVLFSEQHKFSPQWFEITDWPWHQIASERSTLINIHTLFVILPVSALWSIITVIISYFPISCSSKFVVVFGDRCIVYCIFNWIVRSVTEVLCLHLIILLNVEILKALK